MRMAAALLAWPQVTDCRANGKGGRWRARIRKVAGDDRLFTARLVSRRGGNVQGFRAAFAAIPGWFGGVSQAVRSYWRSMIFSENRHPLFGIML
jgi:hypothetical protein